MTMRSLVTFGLDPQAQRAVTALAEAQQLRASHAALESGPPGLAGDVGLVSLERDLGTGLATIAALARAGVRVVALAGSKDADVILAAMRAGADEFAVTGDDEALRTAIANDPAAGREGMGRITAVFGAKGGLGATTVATNVAGAIARRDARACVLDLDPVLGAVASVLDVAPEYGITDVIANMRRLDRELIDASVPRHGSGVWMIAPGDDVEAAERIDAAAITALLGFLRRHFDALLVDGLHAFDERNLAALDAADRVLLVVTQEVAAVRNAQRCLELFGKLGYPSDKLLVVLNRFRKGATISPAIVEETLGTRVAATVANDFQTLARAVAKGALLVDEAPRSQLARDVERVAELIGVTPADAPSHRSIFGRIFNGKVAAHGAH